jgi:glutamate/tyrosine decarboxylase-like PLP-dependent enzyme
MDYLARALAAVTAWREAAGPYPPHPALEPDPARFDAAFAEFSERMTSSYPFHHPRYAGQMLKPPHPVAIAAYTAAMHVNANNHALDGGPATSALEVEVMGDLGRMFGFPEDALGHLTSSGTIANLEALWVARELHPGKAIAFDTNAHYTHSRMCAVLGVEGIATDDLEAAARSGRVGTVVVTAGTTGLGTVDPVEEAVRWRDRYGVRVHVDAAYGGFFTLLDDLVPVRSFRAIADADSVVVDPHKHGLQPYGCGAVLFRDPAVGRLYKHDSPYTYFTSGELHLGEISLECSRAGAAAAALWLTLRSLDLAPVLAAGVRAARAWADLLRESDELRLHIDPQLDIVAYFPRRARASEIDAESERILNAGMTAEDPVYLSTLRIDGPAFAALHPDVELDTDGVRVLRSVLMKPEHEPHVPWLHERVSALSAISRR